MSANPFQALDTLELGNEKSVLIDALLLPYLIEAVNELTDYDLWSGDAEDVEGTVKAFEELIARLTETPV